MLSVAGTFSSVRCSVLRWNAQPGMGQGVVDHHVDDTGGFRFGSPLKGQACRRVPEEMFHGDEGPVSHPHRLNGRFDPVFHHDAGPASPAGLLEICRRTMPMLARASPSETKG